MRRDAQGVYTVTFSEDIREGKYIISPRVDFSVTVRTMSGLMSLGYNVGAVITRSSTKFQNGVVIVSLDEIQQLSRRFCQVKGLDLSAVRGAAAELGLTEFIPRSYIELTLEAVRTDAPGERLQPRL